MWLYRDHSRGLPETVPRGPYSLFPGRALSQMRRGRPHQESLVYRLSGFAASRLAAVKLYR